MPTEDLIIQKIEEAFKNVKLGNGIGLWEAQAIDDYESELKQKKAREKDEKKSWQALTPEVLQRCNSSLSFFDAEGMRFHIPAFIIESIKDINILDPIFHLTYLSRNRFILLNKKQKDAISLYLKWCLSQKDYEFEFHSIKLALKTYWDR